MWKQEERASRIEHEDEITKIELDRVNKVLELRRTEANEARREMENLTETVEQLVLKHNYGIKLEK